MNRVYYGGSMYISLFPCPYVLNKWSSFYAWTMAAYIHGDCINWITFFSILSINLGGWFVVYYTDIGSSFNDAHLTKRQHIWQHGGHCNGEAVCTLQICLVTLWQQSNVLMGSPHQLKNVHPVLSSNSSLHHHNNNILLHSPCSHSGSRKYQW